MFTRILFGSVYILLIQPKHHEEMFCALYGISSEEYRVLPVIHIRSGKNEDSVTFENMVNT